MADQWYYFRHGQQKGPVTEDQLRHLASFGQLKPTDFVWKEGMASWTAASEISGLFSSGAKPSVGETFQQYGLCGLAQSSGIAGFFKGLGEVAFAAVTAMAATPQASGPQQSVHHYGDEQEMQGRGSDRPAAQQSTSPPASSSQSQSRPQRYKIVRITRLGTVWTVFDNMTLQEAHFYKGRVSCDPDERVEVMPQDWT